MSLDLLFSLAGAAAVVGWLALAVVPLRFGFPRTVAVGTALGIAMLYAALIAVYWGQGQGGFESLDAVARLLDTRGLLLAGWVHYLAFDLLLGAWQREEARRIGLPQLVLVPCLLMTFLFGPFGWLMFMAMRQFRRDVAAAPAA
jgi:hypothetical protein